MADTGSGIVAGYDGHPAAVTRCAGRPGEAWARHTTLTVILTSDFAPAGEPAVKDLIKLARQRGELTVARGCSTPQRPSAWPGSGRK